jgi:natural product precursor
MKSKIKLTDLSHLDPLNDEMAHLKGGDDPDEGPLCWGCKCSCQCSIDYMADATSSAAKESKRDTGNSSWGVDMGIGVGITITGGILLL